MRLALTLFLALPLAFGQTIGEALPPWTPGVLDIHHINTGKGDSALLIFPDGTSMLVDAGETLRPPPRITPPKPDDSRPPGEWIARYASHMLRAIPAEHLDYALLTHFHGDHMGEIDERTPASATGRYKLTGITQAGDRVPFRLLLDRGWPNYHCPAPSTSEMMANYRDFIMARMELSGMRVERFQPGRRDQIVLRREPAKYPNFEIRNLAANGAIWTGEGSETRGHFPDLAGLAKSDWPSENMCSIAFRLRYGRFDYFNGGDIIGGPNEGSPEWHDVETPVARVTGPVDVHVLNHHGFHDSANAFFVQTLRPRVHIMSVYSPTHPGQRVLSRLFSTRLYPGPRDVFATNIMEVTRVVLGDSHSRLKSDQGHILVRVDPGGDTYRVIILDDSTESFKVKAVHGPYESR